MFLLLRIKVLAGRSRGKSLISFIKTKDWQAQFTAMQTENRLAVNQRKSCKSEMLRQILWGEAIHI